MPNAAPKNPAHFKIRDTDAILARQGELWMGVGYGALGSDKLETLFERNDEQIEAVAADQGYKRPRTACLPASPANIRGTIGSAKHLLPAFRTSWRTWAAP